MPDIDSSLYVREIEELTDLLRNNEEWSDLRGILDVKGFDPDELLLASFIEDEDEYEYGVFVTNDKKIYEYKRSTAEGENSEQYFECVDCTSSKEVELKYPQVAIAIQMLQGSRGLKGT